MEGVKIIKVDKEMCESGVDIHSSIELVYDDSLFQI